MGRPVVGRGKERKFGEGEGGRGGGVGQRSHVIRLNPIFKIQRIKYKFFFSYFIVSDECFFLITHLIFY